MKVLVRKPTEHVRKFDGRFLVIVLGMLWLAQVALYLVLGLMGLDFGFKVWPIGEDLNWIAFMLDGTGSSVAQQLWKVDGRNPLSPWWYIAAEPLIRATPFGLHIVSQLVYPLLSVSIFLTIERLSRGRARLFAFSVALIVLFWTFTGRFDHIQWNMFAAMGCALLSVYFYCGFVDGGRASSRALVLSLLFYLIALATYTLQSGALVAVAFLALFRSAEPFKERFLPALIDVCSFGVLFAIFYLIWVTTTPFPPSSFALDWSLLVRQLEMSVRYFLVPPILLAHWSDAQVAFPAHCMVYVFCLASLSFGALLAKVSQTFPLEFSRALVGWVLVVLLAIGAPTVLLEATNTTWAPGTRSIMVQPIFQPLLYVSLIFGVAALVNKRWASLVAVVLVATLASCVLVAALGYNHRQVALTRQQMSLADALKKVPMGASRPLTFIVRHLNYDAPYVAMEPTWAHAIRTYGRVVFGDPNVQVRSIRFAGTAANTVCTGVMVSFVDGGAEIGGAFYPDSQIMVVQFDGKEVAKIESLKASDFQNLCVLWRRSVN